MATIQQLAERKAKLEAELAEVKAEIASRAGEVDEDAAAAEAPKKTGTKKTAAKTAAPRK